VRKCRHLKEDVSQSSDVGGKPNGCIINLQEILVDHKGDDAKAFEISTIFGAIKVRDSADEKKPAALRPLGANLDDFWQSKTQVKEQVQDDKTGKEHTLLNL
jgi:hypothetical protein